MGRYELVACDSQLLRCGMSQLFDADAMRKIKKEPPVAMEMGKHMALFPREEVLGGDVISELWGFGSK